MVTDGNAPAASLLPGEVLRHAGHAEESDGKSDAGQRTAPAKCHPVDLAQPDHTAARGQPLTHPAPGPRTLCPRAAMW